MSNTIQRLGMIEALAHQMLKEAARLRQELGDGNPPAPSKEVKPSKAALRRNARILAKRPTK